MQWLSDTRGVPSSAQGRLREALPSNNAVPLLQQCAVLLVVVSAVMDVPVADVLMADAQVSAKLGDPQRVDRVVHRVAEPADAQKMMLIILSAQLYRGPMRPRHGWLPSPLRHLEPPDWLIGRGGEKAWALSPLPNENGAGSRSS